MIKTEPVKTIWGKAVLYLREQKNVGLHVLCGDITNVELKDEKLVLKTDEKFIFDMVSSQENISEIKKALAWQGYNVEVEIVKTTKDEDLIKEDIDKLKSLDIKFRVE